MKASWIQDLALGATTGLALLFGGALTTRAYAAPGDVRALLFSLRDCDHCRAVKEEVLPAIQAAFPLVIRELDASNIENAWRLLLFQRAHGVAEGQVPALAVGSEFLVGEQEIRARLLDVVLRLASRGGSDWPADPDPNVPPPATRVPVPDACGGSGSAADACGSGAGFGGGIPPEVR